MPPEESSEAKYDRLKRQLQDSILNDYPNPERKDCPGDAIILSLAERATDEKVEIDSHWHHLTHCSECYREFLDLRRRLKSSAERKRHLIQRAAIVGLALVIGITVWYSREGFQKPKRPQNAELAYSKLTIDIPTMTRSEIGRANAPINLQRKPTELTVQFPVGSKAGEYEFRLLKGSQQIRAADALASISRGTTALTIKIDLSDVPSGSYSISVRQPPWDWSYVPVVVH